MSPCAMRSTAFIDGPGAKRRHGALLARRCTGYLGFGSVNVPCPILYSADWPAAGLLTTAGDHTRFLMALLREDLGRLVGLSPTSVAMLTKPQAQMAVTPASRPTKASGPV